MSRVKEIQERVGVRLRVKQWNVPRVYQD